MPSKESAVELPLIEQLRVMGWTHLAALTEDGRPTGRASFRETMLEDRLRAKLRELNTEDGQVWLDDRRLSQAVAVLHRAIDQLRRLGEKRHPKIDVQVKS
ncbi:hypothetical protein GTS_56700 [Gandjariella thermophila]|uniref:Uncharacterized protein n=1 Tax=Gandjariella thermophila TaxID=1931992 RepID=A0A4D4JJE1_9PSEU|nr:hypothetical protein GTS_56700 [Gandjariella thermophila]